MTTTYTSRDEECIAYISALVTLELCAEIHRKGKPNTAIRRCCKLLAPRFERFPRVNAIILGLARQPMPAGAIHHLHRHLEEQADGNVVLEDEQGGAL